MTWTTLALLALASLAGALLGQWLARRNPPPQ